MRKKPLAKSGFISLIGRSNVGKSTLLNALIGTKIAAVTEKPQTTRNNIHGVLNTESGQAVFVDTPGIFKHKKSLMSSILLKRAREAMQDINLILYVVDPSKQIGAEERYSLSLLRKTEMPKILIINKSDLAEKEKKYLEDYRELGSEFQSVFVLSALKLRHLKPLLDKIFELLPAGEPYYEAGQLTNLTSKNWIAEIIREKIFNSLRQEVPYSTHVEVEQIEEKPTITVIEATIFTNNSHYKKIIIGQQGRTIKNIGASARKELEIALNKKVYLSLEVETDKHWEKRV